MNCKIALTDEEYRQQVTESLINIADSTENIALALGDIVELLRSVKGRFNSRMDDDTGYIRTLPITD